MKIQVDDIQPKQAALTIIDNEIYLINSIRRIMLSELPKLAIDNVIIYDNTTALFDEIISHRLGLIPIPTDLSLLNFRDDCVCKGEGCPSCTVRYTLSKEGEGMVYSGDLQANEDSWSIKEDSIPLVELFDNQRLILEVEAILGKGGDHAKWQPVIAPGFKLIPSISFDQKYKEDVEEFIKELPEGLVTMKKDSLELNDLKNLAVFESYLQKERIDFISVSLDESNIQFHFLTDGSLDAKDALAASIQIFEDKLGEFEKQLKKIK
jgi:DNA-directed RNA polymerase subunit D